MRITLSSYDVPATDGVHSALYVPSSLSVIVTVGDASAPFASTTYARNGSPPVVLSFPLESLA